MDKNLVLQKGQALLFLDYKIQNSRNNDGLVLSKAGEGYESHLGNYGEGTEENVENCKRYAVMFFMVARPEIFAHSVVNRMCKLGSGTMHDYFLFKRACEDEKIPMPSEVTPGDGINSSIYFNKKPLWKK